MSNLLNFTILPFLFCLQFSHLALKLSLFLLLDTCMFLCRWRTQNTRSIFIQLPCIIESGYLLRATNPSLTRLVCKKFVISKTKIWPYWVFLRHNTRRRPSRIERCYLLELQQYTDISIFCNTDSHNTSYLSINVSNITIYVDFLNLKNLSKRASLVKAIHHSSKLERCIDVQTSFIQYI